MEARIFDYVNSYPPPPEVTDDIAVAKLRVWSYLALLRDCITVGAVRSGPTKQAQAIIASAESEATRRAEEKFADAEEAPSKKGATSSEK